MNATLPLMNETLPLMNDTLPLMNSSIPLEDEAILSSEPELSSEMAFNTTLEAPLASFEADHSEVLLASN